MADGRYRLDGGSWVDFTLTAGEYEVPSVDANLVEVVPFGTLVSEAAIVSELLTWGGWVVRNETLGSSVGTHTYNITIGAEDVGKTLVFFHGPQVYTDTATVNGNAASFAVANDGQTSGKRTSLFEYVIQAGDVGNIIVSCTGASGTTGARMALGYMFAAAGTSIAQTFRGVKNGVLEPFTQSVTPGAAGSAIGAFIASPGEWLVPQGAWTAPMAFPTGSEYDSVTNMTSSAGLALDQPASPVTVTFTPDAGAEVTNAVWIVFTVEPV